MSQTALTVLGFIVGAPFATWVGMFVKHRADRAARATAATAKAITDAATAAAGRRGEVEGYDMLANRLDTLNQRMTREGDELRAEMESVKRRLEKAQRALAGAGEYISRLLAYIKAELPQHSDIPAMPPEVHDLIKEHRPGR